MKCMKPFQLSNNCLPGSKKSSFLWNQFLQPLEFALKTSLILFGEVEPSISGTFDNWNHFFRFLEQYSKEKSSTVLSNHFNQNNLFSIWFFHSYFIMFFLQTFDWKNKNYISSSPCFCKFLGLMRFQIREKFHKWNFF